MQATGGSVNQSLQYFKVIQMHEALMWIRIIWGKEPNPSSSSKLPHPGVCISWEKKNLRCFSPPAPRIHANEVE